MWRTRPRRQSCHWRVKGGQNFPFNGLYPKRTPLLFQHPPPSFALLSVGKKIFSLFATFPFFFFFFLMPGRQPIPPLFPYRPLFRSNGGGPSCLEGGALFRGGLTRHSFGDTQCGGRAPAASRVTGGSRCAKSSIERY